MISIPTPSVIFIVQICHFRSYYNLQPTIMSLNIFVMSHEKKVSDITKGNIIQTVACTVI